MSNVCPSCGGRLITVDLNAEYQVEGRVKNYLYEYRHAPNDGRCSLAVAPGDNYIRCYGCTKWIPGGRNDGPLLCFDCIDAGVEYGPYDLKPIQRRTR